MKRCWCVLATDNGWRSVCVLLTLPNNSSITEVWATGGRKCTYPGGKSQFLTSYRFLLRQITRVILNSHQFLPNKSSSWQKTSLHNLIIFMPLLEDTNSLNRGCNSAQVSVVVKVTVFLCFWVEGKKENQCLSSWISSSRITVLFHVC